jgi:hypothetical protein
LLEVAVHVLEVAVGRGQVLDHAIERRSEQLQLVLGVDGYPHAEVAARQRLRGQRQVTDRARDAHRLPAAQQQANHHAGADEQADQPQRALEPRRGVGLRRAERVVHALGREAIAHRAELLAVLTDHRRRDLEQVQAEALDARHARRFDLYLVFAQAERAPGVALGHGRLDREGAAGERQRIALLAHVHAVDQIAVVLYRALDQALHVEEGIVERQAAQRERVVLGQHAAFAGDAFFDVLLHRAQVLGRGLSAHHPDDGQRRHADDARHQQQGLDELVSEALGRSEETGLAGVRELHDHSKM